jgi:hypothetical protein
MKIRKKKESNELVQYLHQIFHSHVVVFHVHQHVVELMDQEDHKTKELFHSYSRRKINSRLKSLNIH